MSYFPVLRSKRSEILALRELTNEIAGSLIVPVIEPVAVEPTLLISLPQFVDAGMEFCLIVNPRLPRTSPPTQETIFNMVISNELDDFEGFRPAFYVDGQTRVSEIQAFTEQYAELQRAYFLISEPRVQVTAAIVDDQPSYVLIREPGISSNTRNSFDLQCRVLIEDRFVLRNNAEYPSSEFFSDRHTGSMAEDFPHFGDYSIQGDRFQVGGGQPYAVAIHYMSTSETGHLELCHYISDQHETRGNVPEKFLEALEKLVACNS
jgi:hypothetical protein